MIIYGIYDKKALAFITLFEADNDDLAVRSLYRFLEQGRGDLVKFPADFAVYQLAEYDFKTGNIKPFDVKPVAFELLSLFKKSSDSSEIVSDVSEDSPPQADK